jgi:hypothetical protein
MKVGIDFDNTIVCYDRLFHRLAAERGLVDDSVPATKGHVRDHLRACGREQDWVELQGLGYGTRLGEAEAFPGVVGFLAVCKARGVRTHVISHKTRKPFAGPDCDLHEAAWDWLRAHGLLGEAVTGLTPDRVFFELTKQEKLARVAAVGCDVFIDDLPELLTEPSFPKGPRRVLFDPAGLCPDHPLYERVTSWDAVTRLLLRAEAA